MKNAVKGGQMPDDFDKSHHPQAAGIDQQLDAGPAHRRASHPAQPRIRSKRLQLGRQARPVGIAGRFAGYDPDTSAHFVPDLPVKMPANSLQGLIIWLT